MHASSSTSSANFKLPPEVLEFCDVAKRIVRDELMPLEQEWLSSPNQAYGMRELPAIRAAFSPEVAKKIEGLSRDTGLWYLMVPEQYGGMGLPMLTQVAILEQLYYTPITLPLANVPNILYECKGDQVDRFLKPIIEGTKTTAFAQTEPNAGSDPGGMMQTRAVRKGNGWVLNGTKMWISNADECDFLMVQAVTDAEKRQRGGITMFLVDRKNPGLRVEVPGIRTWLSTIAKQHVVHFDDVFVPDEDVLGEVGKGFTLGQRWLTIHDRLLRGPYALGKMQRALDMSVEWAKQRVTFGKRLSERQAIQWHLVDMHIDITALRSMTYEVAARADAGDDVRSEAALVKLCAGEWGARCVDHGIQVHGAMGESLDLPLTLFYRLLRHAQIGGGASEIQRILIARKLLG
jgi:acyl-CoA dehydrogenase